LFTEQINLRSIYALTADVIKISAARPINNAAAVHACFAIAFQDKNLPFAAAATFLMKIDKKIMRIIMYRCP